MIRIIVVDDEPRQRKGLVEIIRKLRPSDDVMAMKDGEQVLHYVQNNEADIIFSDIRMPRMNGLELARQLLADKSKPIVILISVYADFEYARSALELGAFGYLLKPVAVSELKKILEKAIEKSRERKESFLSQDHRKIASALGIYQEHLVKKWLYGEVGEEELNGYIPEYRLGYLIYLKLPEMEDREQQLEVMENAVLWIKQYFSESWIFSFQEENDRNILTLMILMRDEKIDFAMTAERFLRNIRKEYGNEVCMLVSAAFNGTTLLISQISREFRMAKRLLFYGPFEKVMFPEDWPEEEEYGNGNVMEFARDIQAKILEEEKEGAQNRLKHFMEVPEEGRVIRPDILKEMTVNLFWWILEGVNDFISEDEKNILWKECIELKKCSDYKELKSKSSELLEKVMRCCKMGKLRFSPIQQAVSYINRHFTEEMSLNTLAEKYHYSPNYFSSIFKTFTGENLVSYVNRLRMEKAADYMKVRGLKNQEIAGKVGIPDYKYFNKLFKKHYGMSAQEYRKHLENEEAGE